MTRWLLVSLLIVVVPIASATDIVIVNKDAVGEGLNDTAPREPVGGNPGDTLGEQRRYALQYAAQILESRLVSTATIRIVVNFKVMSCARGQIAAAGAKYLVANFNNNPLPNTLYPTALANALAHRRLELELKSEDISYADIIATFTSSIDSPEYPDCIRSGTDWYYGFDGQTPDDDLNFLNTAIHEFIHGLGFQTFVSLQTGQLPKGSDGKRMPDIYSAHVKALSLPYNPLWSDESVSADERRRSAHGEGVLVWEPRGNSNTANAVRRHIDSGKINSDVKLYVPSALKLGSSVSHFTIGVSPEQIMGPFANDSKVGDGLGLSICILRDMGWVLASDVRCPDNDSVPEFQLSQVDEDRDANGNTGDDTGSGGGGCTMDRNAAFDPVLAGLVLLALGVLGWRRRLMDGI